MWATASGTTSASAPDPDGLPFIAKERDTESGLDHVMARSLTPRLRVGVLIGRRLKTYHRSMAELHITEAELVRDITSVLDSSAGGD
jgi:hypothetical protein